MIVNGTNIFIYLRGPVTVQGFLHALDSLFDAVLFTVSRRDDEAGCDCIHPFQILKLFEGIENVYVGKVKIPRMDSFWKPSRSIFAARGFVQGVR